MTIRSGSGGSSALFVDTIQALAMAIDARDHTRGMHIPRVRLFAVDLARALGVSEPDVAAIELAALLHDVGKLAVPSHILTKPGPLTPDEFGKIRTHSEVGAAIVGSVAFPEPVASLIRHHHERWDGKGYPDGLSGGQIPFGARIVAVVDSFDALTTEAPYHRPVSPQVATDVLRAEAGKGLDPAIVEKFIEMLPALLERAASLGAGVVSPGVAPITAAHREVHGLYQVASAIATTMGVAEMMGAVAAALPDLVPSACFALFVCDEEKASLSCQFARGTDADAIAKLRLRPGDGIAGWVAHHRRSVVNGRPGADLETVDPGRPTSLQSALVCPLVLDDKAVGVLAVYHSEPEFYSDEHRRLLESVCDLAAPGIRNAILFEQTMEDSLTDEVTGLPNPRFLFKHLVREFARAKRLGAQVALFVLDLDDFKQVRKTHGQAIAERALREVGRVLRTQLKPYDLAVRYHKDEFILVVSGCGPEEAERFGLAVQAALDEVHIGTPDGPLAVAASVGAAVFPDEGEEFEALVVVAGERMRKDKAERKGLQR